MPVPEATYGEVWMTGDRAKIVYDPLETFSGKPLEEMLSSVGSGFLGSVLTRRYGGSSLLLKLLWSSTNLSIQNHPSDRYVKEHEETYGKTYGKAECAYVIAADKGAYMYYGLKASHTKDEIRQACSDGSIIAMLNKVSLREGDVVFTKPGVIHAYGPGLLLAELQEPSAITFRLYDHGRIPERELHLDRGLEVADLSAAPPKVKPILVAKRQGYVDTGLVSMPEFSLRVIDLSPGVQYTLKAYGSAHVIQPQTPLNLICNGAIHSIDPGHACLVGAGIQYTLHAESYAICLVAYVASQGDLLHKKWKANNPTLKNS